MLATVVTRKNVPRSTIVMARGRSHRFALHRHLRPPKVMMSDAEGKEVILASSARANFSARWA